ncbi:hypothetical protein AGDE_17212 [Angomonas deanei]|nr:hypothetical protein AGDE_17212 [Angomonas deanei]|eukprot:EPY15033.1 hypothetical protein AGDE_17212 [Angomonas deanei]
MELYPIYLSILFLLSLYQASMTDTVPVAQWIALQTEVNTLQRENRELQAENRLLQGKLNDLLNEKMTWVEEKSALRGERITLQNKYDNLKKEHDELVEEHRDYSEEMINLNTRLKQELEQANDKQFKMDEQRKVLLDKFYSYSTGQYDLTALLNYSKQFYVSVDVIKDALRADHRETLALPNNLNSLVGDVNVKEFLETVVASLQNLKSTTGYFESIEDCGIQYKQGKIPHNALQSYCAGYNGITYQVTQDKINTIQSAGQSVSEYLATVLPLLPGVIYVDVYNTDITTLDWCEGLPERIHSVDIRNCHHIQDCSPLLKMKGLKTVYYDNLLNASLDVVKDQLARKGVLFR